MAVIRLFRTDPAADIWNTDMTTEDKPETARERMTITAVIVVFLVVLVGGGIWLANSLVTLRKNQDCALSGRKNCADISVPARERW
jgi:hypothetical protein